MYRPENPAPPTVLIDVDGTIVDSLPAIAAAFRQALRAVDQPLPPESFIRRIPGPPMVQTLAALGLTEAQVSEAFSVYMDIQRAGGWRQAKLFSGWPELLAQWRAAGVRCATATSKGEYFARKTLAHLGLLDSFDFIGAAADDGSRQTKTEVLHYTLSCLGLPLQSTARPNHRVVMIGDREHDIDGAAQFGIPTIAVSWGYGADAELNRADAVATSPEHLDRLVREMLYL